MGVGLGVLTLDEEMGRLTRWRDGTREVAGGLGREVLGGGLVLPPEQTVRVYGRMVASLVVWCDVYQLRCGW